MLPGAINKGVVQYTHKEGIEAKIISGDNVNTVMAIAKKAGVRTVMITGDHVATATAIAKELGKLGDLTIAMFLLDLRCSLDRHEEIK